MNNDPKDYLSALRRIDELANELDMFQKWYEEEKECCKHTEAQLAKANAEVERAQKQAEVERKDAQQANRLWESELRARREAEAISCVLFGIFSDYEQPCLDVDTARRIWNDLNTQLAAAQEDVARIDWLDENMGHNGGGNGGRYWFDTPADVECGMLRVAIDAARAKDQARQEARKE